MKIENTLYTFIAGAAIQGNDPFSVHCNCGGVITVMPPMQENQVVCPMCETTIKMLVVEGDPGYVIGQGGDGQPTLLPVQGSTAKPINMLSKEERQIILAKVK
ncbi:MAG: hypothetical protein ACYDA4_15515, partial [Ignavibacteriaceae bacterium]